MPGVVRGFRYAYDVIVAALTRRRTGLSWEKCALAATADGLVATSVVRWWGRRFQHGSDQQLLPFSLTGISGILRGNGWKTEAGNGRLFAASPPAQRGSGC